MAKGKSTASQWNRSMTKQVAKQIPKGLLTRFADFYKDAQGSRYSANKGQSKTLQLSIENNPATFIERPESNRWLDKDVGESLTPIQGAVHIQQPSTAIESIIINKEETKPGDSSRYKVSISFTGDGTKYYDYWATEKEIDQLMNAGSKGREVALHWNNTPEKHCS